MRKAPVSVVVIACLYIAAGAVGIAGDFSHFQSPQRLSYDAFIPLIHLLGIICGVFMLRAGNWARWLAVAWIAFHVVISALDSWTACAIHTVLLVVLVYFLSRPAANRYFHSGGADDRGLSSAG